MTAVEQGITGGALIELQGLTRVFQTDEMDTYALHEISLRIQSGEYVAITGPSGCGKSTLLSLLGLLDAPTAGTYLLKGKPVDTLGFTARASIRNREIGFIFQAFNLIPDLRVDENVALPMTYRDDISAVERRQRVKDALDMVGMSHRARHYPSQLSGGQQQRVAVARALAGKPALLLADEPTGNLDSHNGEAVMQLLDQLHQNGATLCMVTHDMAFAERATRIIRLFDGKVVDEAIFEQLRNSTGIPSVPPNRSGAAHA